MSGVGSAGKSAGLPAAPRALVALLAAIGSRFSKAPRQAARVGVTIRLVATSAATRSLRRTGCSYPPPYGTERPPMGNRPPGVDEREFGDAVAICLRPMVIVTGGSRTAGESGAWRPVWRRRSGTLRFPLVRGRLMRQFSATLRPEWPGLYSVRSWSDNGRWPNDENRELETIEPS